MSEKLKSSATSPEFRAAFDNAQNILAQTEKVIMGKKSVINHLIIALISEGHVLIEDVPGVGKTTMAAALAKTTDLSYRRAQFTPDVMPSDITGFSIYNKASGEFEYKQGLAMCNILLADEINRTSPKTQSALLEVMEEGTVTVDGKTYKVPAPFMVIATQNPTGFIGTHPLPEAQLDRFIMKIAVGYPAQEDEIKIISERRQHNPMEDIKTVISPEQLLDIQKIVKGVHIDADLYKYIVELVAFTRSHPYVALGASPRASLALMKLSQAHAFMAGRDYVIPDDVLDMFIPAINHRITLKQEAKLKKVSAEDVLKHIKTQVVVKVSKPVKDEA
ncbi:MAG: AAA family ATPase [Eubacteriales bacterium]